MAEEKVAIVELGTAKGNLSCTENTNTLLTQYG